MQLEIQMYSIYTCLIKISRILKSKNMYLVDINHCVSAPDRQIDR